ncbi:hypothetical protein ACX3O0_15165 [Homoserinimonas sp. A447]
MTASGGVATNRVLFGILGLALGMLGTVAVTIMFPGIAVGARPALTPLAHQSVACNIGYRAWETIPRDGSRIVFAQEPETANDAERDIRCLLEALDAPAHLVRQTEQADTSGEKRAIWKHYAIVWERSADGFGATIVITTPDPRRPSAD